MPCLRSNISRMLDRDDRRNGQTARRSRIELGYYRATDRFTRWRRWLCAAAVLAAAAWIATSAIASRSALVHAWSLEPTKLASKGPLAQPHAIWDSNCAACHVSFAPINGSRWAPSPWGGSDRGSKKCTACHAGPAHHKTERKDAVPDCAECHRDHRGREASLREMDDSACTGCHENLPSHRIEGAGPLEVAARVTRFDPEHHPDLTAAWRARSGDPRRIKFNHALHLAAGLTLEPGGAPLSFDRLPPSDRARFGWSDQLALSGRVQLTCASCHETDAGESPQSVNRGANRGEPRAPGAYMLPVVYENHCASCHPLAFDAKLPAAQARHGISAQEVLGEIRQLYTAQAVKTDPDLLRQFVPSRAMPGEATSQAKQVIERAVDEKVLTAARLLFGAALDENVRRAAKLPAGRRGCVECHVLKPVQGRS